MPEEWHRRSMVNRREYMETLLAERDRIQQRIEALDEDILDHTVYIQERFKHGPADNSDGTPASTSDGRG